MVKKVNVGAIVKYYEGDGEAAYGSYPHIHNMRYEEARDYISKFGKEAAGTNGTRFHPAIVTRIWSDTCVNLQIFFDAGKVEVKTSVSFLPEEVFAEGLHCTNSGWLYREIEE